MTFVVVVNEINDISLADDIVRCSGIGLSFAGSEEMELGFVRLLQELLDIETRLRNGGLGGVINYAEWEAKLMAAPDIATMVEAFVLLSFFGATIVVAVAVIVYIDNRK